MSPLSGCGISQCADQCVAGLCAGSASVPTTGSAVSRSQALELSPPIRHAAYLDQQSRRPGDSQSGMAAYSISDADAVPEDWRDSWIYFPHGGPNNPAAAPANLPSVPGLSAISSPHGAAASAIDWHKRKSMRSMAVSGGPALVVPVTLWPMEIQLLGVPIALA